MKILLINVSNTGSTGTITMSLYNEFKRLGHDVYFICGRHLKDKSDPHIIKGAYELESKIHHFFANRNGNLYGGMPLSTLRIKRLIKKINPDVVHLHCLNGYFVSIYSLITWLKKRKQNTVLTNHAEFMFTGNCGYTQECEKWKNEGCHECPIYKTFSKKDKTKKHFKKMHDSFKNFFNLKVTNVSPWITNKAETSIILNEFKHFTVLNPVSIKNEFVPKQRKDKTIKLLYVTPDYSDPLKGFSNLSGLMEALPENYEITIISKNKNNLEQQHIKNAKLILQDISKEEIIKHYYESDLTLLLSHYETFGMAVAESLCCGTPVVGFKAGGPESIAIPEYSSFVERDNSLLIKEIIKFTSKEKDKNISKIAQEKYSVTKIANEYLKIYKE